MSKRDEYHYRWHATVYPNSLHIFQREIQGRSSGNSSFTFLENFIDNDPEGVISRRAAKRIERAVVWLLYYAKQKTIYDVELQKHFKFKINFITLTLPASQIHTDDEIKKVCLNNFLNICRKTYDLENYLWKAEAQINGNIHFHIVTDKYIRYDKILSAWISSLDLLKGKEAEDSPELSYIDRFEKKIGHRFPNCTDIHSVKHVKRVASYIAKYMSKNRAFACIGELRMIKGKTVEILYGSDKYRKEECEKKEGKVVGHIITGPIRKIQGKLWFLSRSLSACKPVRLNEDECEFRDLSTVIEKGELKQFDSDFCFNYYGNIPGACEKFAPWLKGLMDENPKIRFEQEKEALKRRKGLKEN